MRARLGHGVTGITGIDPAHYVVCDRCGWLWDIGADWHDPIMCPQCRHDTLWRFDQRENAEQHSNYIRDRA